MKYVPKVLFALAPVCLLASAAFAQTVQETPESVARAYVAATQSGDWAKVTSLMHPESLAQFKKLFEPIFADEKLAKSFGMMFGISSRAEYDQLSGGQILEKLVGTLGGVLPGFDQMMSKSSFDIVGQVTETPELVHIVYRMQVPLDALQLKDAPNFTKNVSITKMEVMSLKRYENGWRLTLSGEIEGMAQMFANLSSMMSEKDKGAPPPPAKPPVKKKPVRKK